jgi:hypothetical protein
MPFPVPDRFIFVDFTISGIIIVGQPASCGVLEKHELTILIKFIICTPLLFDIIANGSFVTVFPYGTGKVSIRPEFSTPKLLLNVRTPFEYFPGSNAFDDRHCSGHTVRWNALHEKMYMIIIGAYFQEFHLISFLNFYTYLFEYIVYVCVKQRSSVFPLEIRDGREAR